MKTTLSVVIVTCNSAGDIAPCLEALLHQKDPPGDICCIDNASADDTTDIIRSFPSVNLVNNRKNIGFSAACNQGIRETAGDLVLFLNPDAFLASGALQRLARALDEAPKDVAGAGPKLVRSKKGPAGKRILDSAGIALSPSRLAPHDRGQGQYDDGRYDRQPGYLGPSCACALYRRAALLDLAVDGEIFDEDFFAYYEDVDLAWRARLFGWSFRFVPQALVEHDRKNPQAHSAAVQARAFVNRYFCALKNDPALRRYAAPALYESLRLGFNVLTRPGFGRALPHLFNNLGRMLQKRSMIRERCAVDPAVMKEFE